MEEVKKKFVRFLRKNSTEAERELWRILKNRKFCKYKFRRQHVIEGFVVDFFCARNKLAIEVDGSIHKKRVEYDNERDIVIKSKDIRIIRFKNEDILNNTQIVLDKLNKALTESER